MYLSTKCTDITGITSTFFSIPSAAGRWGAIQLINSQTGFIPMDREREKERDIERERERESVSERDKGTDRCIDYR